MEAVLAVYAALVSTGLAILRGWEFFHRDRPRVKVEGKADLQQIGSVYEPADTRYVQVTIRNVGRRPVTIDSIGLELRDERGILPTAFFKGLPAELKEGQSLTKHCHQAELDAQGHTANVAKVVVRDQAGTVWEGPFHRTGSAKDK